MSKAIEFGVKYRVTREASGADIDDIVMLTEDDGSDCKFYVNLSKVGADTIACITDDKLVPCCPLKGVDTVEFGKVYRVSVGNPHSSFYFTGDLLVLCEDDGTFCPWFYNLSKPEQKHKVAALKDHLAVYTGIVRGDDDSI